MQALAHLRVTTLGWIAAAWLGTVLALPRVILAGFYVHHWWQARSRSATDKTFFATIRWTSPWAPMVIVLGPLVLLIVARWAARRAYAVSAP